VKQFYKVLEVNPTSGLDEIKRSYKRLILRFHPDKNGGEENEQFMQVQEAFTWLSDPSKKQLYDTFGDEAVEMLNKTNGNVSSAYIMLENIEREKMKLLMKFFNFMNPK